jgi:hypothetical protein
MTLGDESEDVIEALWKAAEEYGYPLSVVDQVAVARFLAKRRAGGIEANDVKSAFTVLHLRPPSLAFQKSVSSTLKRAVPKLSLRQVLLDYRQFAIRNLSAQFGGKTRGREEELRNNLLTYLPVRGYAEARTGKGRTDILIPPIEAIIEVKVWTDPSTYKDGMEELARYVHAEEPKEATMMLFGDREPLPSILSDHLQAVAEEISMEGLLVPVVVIPFEVEAPSKAALLARRRNRGR